MPTIE